MNNCGIFYDYTNSVFLFVGHDQDIINKPHCIICSLITNYSMTMIKLHVYTERAQMELFGVCFPILLKFKDVDVFVS